MMFYTSKLMAEATEKQELAELKAMGFSEALQDALALADHFECIQADEYILPNVVKMRPRFESTELHALHDSEYTAL